MTDHTVVGDRVALDVGFHAARTRLKILAKGGMLLRACEVAYGAGITALVELAGPAAGLTRLAEVCLEDLSETDDCAHIALQWEAIAADGKLFTALLADLMLVPSGTRSRLCLWRGHTGRRRGELAPGWARRSCAAAPRR